MLKDGQDLALQNSVEMSMKEVAGRVVRYRASEMNEKFSLSVLLVQTETADDFPFVGLVPDRPGNFMAAGFAGHGAYPKLQQTLEMS